LHLIRSPRGTADQREEHFTSVEVYTTAMDWYNVSFCDEFIVWRCNDHSGKELKPTVEITKANEDFIILIFHFVHEFIFFFQEV
jgi:hypothetical protein